jgi:UDP-glucose 4-epimerase
VRFLITGGAGFIGSHLADGLIAEGHHVHVLDDLSTGSMANIRHLKESPRFTYTIDTCVNSALVGELVDDADAVYHLAAAVGVELIVESPVRTIETNIRCTEVVLAKASKKRKPVFLASTSEVFGKSNDLPFREDGDLLIGATSTGRWSYACSKALDEFLAIAYWKERQLPTVIGRLFNTVGPRQTGHYGMVVPRFVRQALDGQPITVYGDGRQSRCFCNVSDVARALIDLMLIGEPAFGEVFNIGSREEITMIGLAERVRELTGAPVEIVRVPYEEAYEQGFEDMRRRVPTTEKVGALIGWAATRSLDDTLREVIAFHRSDQLFATR